MKNPNLLIISNKLEDSILREDLEVRFIRWDTEEIWAFRNRDVLIVDFSFDNIEDLNSIQRQYIVIEEMLNISIIEEGLTVIVICGSKDKNFYVDVPQSSDAKYMNDQDLTIIREKRYGYDFLRKLGGPIEKRLGFALCEIPKIEVKSPFDEYFKLTDKVSYFTFQYEPPELDSNIKIEPICKTEGFCSTCVGGTIQIKKGFLILLPGYDKDKKEDVLSSLIKISRDFYMKKQYKGLEVDPAIPPQIASDYLEALLCKNAGAQRASVAMCRRALQSSLLEMGANEELVLKDQINELFSKGKITKAICDEAHQIRLLGNVGAHPDRDGLKDVSEEDVERILKFIAAYFQCVYITPRNIGV